MLDGTDRAMLAGMDREMLAGVDREMLAHADRGGETWVYGWGWPVESWMHIPSSASPSLVVSEWEEGISGPFSMGPETPNGPEGHRPAQTSLQWVRGWAVMWDPQPAPLSMQSELSQTCCSGRVSLCGSNCCLLPHKNRPEFLLGPFPLQLHQRRSLDHPEAGKQPGLPA